MYRFYWQSGITTRHFDSGGDPGELFHKMLRSLPKVRDPSPGQYLVLYHMRHTGTYHEVIRFEITRRRKPYLDVQRLFDLREAISKYVRA